MSGRTITKYVLACDGCGVEREPFESATEARAEAYNAGWRFPAQLTESGSTSSRASDECPACQPGWKPQPAKAWQARRANGRA